MLICLEHLMRGEEDWEPTLVTMTTMDHVMDIDWRASYKQGWTAFLVAAFQGNGAALENLSLGAVGIAKHEVPWSEVAGMMSSKPKMSLLMCLARGHTIASMSNKQAIRSFMSDLIENASLHQLNFADPAGSTALHVCALHGLDEEVNQLLKRGVDHRARCKVRSMPGNTYTALDMAMHRNEQAPSSKLDSVIQRLQEFEERQLNGSANDSSLEA